MREHLYLLAPAYPEDEEGGEYCSVDLVAIQLTEQFRGWLRSVDLRMTASIGIWASDFTNVVVPSDVAGLGAILPCEILTEADEEGWVLERVFHESTTQLIRTDRHLPFDPDKVLPGLWRYPDRFPRHSAVTVSPAWAGSGSRISIEVFSKYDSVTAGSFNVGDLYQEIEDHVNNRVQAPFVSVGEPVSAE